MLTITLFGAAGEVTGSNTVIDLDGERVAVDCGSFQGSRDANDRTRALLPYQAGDIQAAVLTHAHLDHCGRLPKLVKEGFRGTIFATSATRDLAEIVLNDAVHVAEDRFRRDGTPIPYTLEDVERCMDRFRGVEYGEHFSLTNHIQGQLVDAGHVLGSASVVLTAGKERVVVSGDIGNPGAPIMNDPAHIDRADVVVMEATYGDKTHEKIPDRLAAFKTRLEAAVARGGAVVIPAFSLERTQELLYGLAEWHKDAALANVPVFLDGPMAIKMLDVYRKHIVEFDDEAQAQARANHDLFLFQGLKLTPTADASKAIRNVPNPKIILAGSGMMDGGRIQFHLRDYLPDPKSTILVVGYQAEGTVGRRLVDGERPVRIHDERITVRATVETVTYLSAHADQAALMDWLTAIKGVKTVIIDHSEEATRQLFAEKIKTELKTTVVLPKLGQPVRIRSIGQAVTNDQLSEFTDPDEAPRQ